MHGRHYHLKWPLRFISVSNLPSHYNLLTPLSQTPWAQIVSWLMRLAVGPSLQTSRFYSILVHVKFIVNEAAVVQVFIKYFGSPQSVLFHQ